MTDAPRTTSLFANEWRSLCVGSAQQLVNFFANLPHATADTVTALDEHVQRLRMFTQAWAATPPPFVPQHEPSELNVVPQTNGASGPKRKGGWPKGKPRKPAGEAQGEGEAVQ